MDLTTYPMRNRPKKFTDYDLTLVAVGVILFVLGIAIGGLIF